MLGLGRVAVHRSRFPITHSSNSARQGSSQSLGRLHGTTHGEFDLLVNLAGQTPGLILRPHEVRFLFDACCRPAPSQSWCVSECFDRAGEEQHPDEESPLAALEEPAPRLPSPPILPHTRWKTWSCMNRESRVLRERYRPVLRLTGCRHPHRNPGEMRYAHRRQSLVGRSEQDPANQHQIAATIGLRPRLLRVVSPSLSPVWCNATAATPSWISAHADHRDRVGLMSDGECPLLTARSGM